ncbi:MAG: hypothetical protein K5745_05610 [Saccharofermentans sp.]|nr:hypothetical protein [Saccharofermentans sp.]
MSTLTEAYKVPELKKKLLFTFLIVSAMYVLTLVPIPGLSHSAICEHVRLWGDYGLLLNVLSGKALYNGAITALGIYPFLVASIVMQIATIAIPKLRNLAMLGDEGSKIITKITRFVALGMDVIYAVLFAVGARNCVTDQMPFVLAIGLAGLTVAAGAAFCGWCVELINSKGVGNGITIVIIAAIVRALPHMFKQAIEGSEGGYKIALPIVLAVILLVFIVFAVYVNLAEKKIRILFQKKTVGMKQYGMQNQVIPLKVTQAGIMPIVYSMTILLLWASIVVTVSTKPDQGLALGAGEYTSNILFIVMYVLFVSMFTYIFSMIQFNPIDIANQIKQYGGYIQGIRPGKATSQYLMNTYTNINVANAAFLIILSAIPMLISIAPKLSLVWHAGIISLVVAGGLMETKILLDNGIRDNNEALKQSGREAKKNKYSKNNKR